MNPSELLTPNQMAACQFLGIKPADLDNEFWAKVKKIEVDSFVQTAVSASDADPLAIAKAVAALQPPK